MIKQMHTFYSSKTITIIVLLFSIGGCSTIKGYFPDKRKDYVNSVEIAELIIPSDLLADITPKQALFNKDVAVIASSSTTDTTTSGPPQKTKLSDQLVGELRLQLDETLLRAWNIVGKALSRNSMEVIRRDSNESLFIVQYSPDKKSTTDGSVWDEVLFIFRDEINNEQQYKIQIVANKNGSEVLILNQQGILQIQGAGLKLLNLIRQTIEDDLEEAK